MAATPAPPTQTQYTSASLYVGDLHPDVTETHLFEHFHEIGSIVSIRVCRDNISRRSLGYAYVNFQNPMDAERALDTLNYSVLKGKPLRIMWRNSDPTLRKSGVGNIFIKNLDKSIDNQALHDTFSAFGNILSCKVATDETGKSKGYGFVHFETHDAAEKAINKVNNMRLGPNTVYVGDFIRKSDRMRAIANKWTNVFFKNVDEGVAEDDLKTEFSKHGEVSSFVFNPAKVKGKGFGFVNYMTHDEASKAVEALNGAKSINGNETESSLFVGKAQKKEERQAMLKQQYEERRKERLEKFQGVNLYVKHLDDKVDEEQLKEEFKQFGTIQNVKIMRNDKGESRNFGFVCFKKPEEASKALAEMNGKMINEKPIYVALAQRKEVRRAQLQAQFAQRSAQYRMVPGMQPQMYPQVFYPGMQPRMVPFPPQAGMPVRRWDQPRPGKVARGGFAMAPSYAMAAGRGAPAGRRGAQNKGPKTNKKPQAPKTEGQDVIDPAVLASATPEEKRNILGSRLFAMVSAQIGADLAPKVTGVLLSMETPEVLHLMESQTDFTEVVNKAVEALSQAAEAQPAQEPEPEAQPAQ